MHQTDFWGAFLKVLNGFEIIMKALHVLITTCKKKIKNLFGAFVYIIQALFSLKKWLLY
jgi:hypothetical protein